MGGGTEQTLLTGLVGGTLLLAVKEALLARRGPRLQASAWSAGWCIAAATYLVGRLLQLEANAPAEAVLAARVRLTAGLTMTVVAVGMSRALGGRRGWVPHVRGFAAAVAGLVALTHLTSAVFQDRATRRVTALGQVEWVAEAGPLLVPLIVALAVTTIAYVQRQLRRRPAATPMDLPVTHGELRWLALLMGLAVLNDITVQLGLNPSVRVFHWAFAFSAVLISTSQDLRVAGVFERLEQTVDDRTRALREQEARLALADRLASLGTLAAGAAHEINNPLSVVATNAVVMLETLEKAEAEVPEEVREELGTLAEEIREGARRVQRTVRDLRTLTREPPTTMGAVELLSLTEATAPLVRHELRHRARLEIDVPAGLSAWADEGRLGQVLLNLLINAAHAIPPGDVEAQRVRVSARPRGELLEIAVEDTGSGIPAENLAHIFEPFFTTKPQGEGTGLGLSVCYGLVRALGGTIDVDSTPGVGTTFTLRLRRAESTRRSGTRAVAAAPEHRARVLIIDDDAVVARTLARTLRDHDVSIATDPREGLRRCRSEPFDVVLCDVMMPEMTGPQLLLRLERSDDACVSPEAVVFISGGAFESATREALEHLPNRLLEKPLDVTELRGLVAAARRAGPARAAAAARA
ncbi:MAG: ATP-binding protein [Myxococcota bacterium]